MTFKTSKEHPPRVQGDSLVTELYRLIATDVADGEALHQTEVRAFLLILRASADYDVYIRSVATIHVPKEAPIPSMYMTQVSYTLVGDIDQPLP